VREVKGGDRDPNEMFYAGGEASGRTPAGNTSPSTAAAQPASLSQRHRWKTAAEVVAAVRTMQAHGTSWADVTAGTELSAAVISPISASLWLMLSSW